jgi:hypothetical protein
MTDKDKMSLQDKIPFLKDEYLFLEKSYEDFDARLMTIKGWSATVAVAAIGLGFYQSPYLWLFAAGASLIFCILEATWKVFQYNYRGRIEALEKAFRTNNFSEIEPFQIYKSWDNALQKSHERTPGFTFLSKTFHFTFFTTIYLPIVWFPHAITAVVGVILFILWLLGIYDLPSSK